MRLIDIKNELIQICKAYNLGKLIAWRTIDKNLNGYHVAQFRTEKETNLTHYFRVK